MLISNFKFIIKINDEQNTKMIREPDADALFLLLLLRSILISIKLMFANL